MQWVQLPPVTPAPHMSAGGSPKCFILFQLPANASGKAAGDGLCTGFLAALLRDWNGVPGFSLADSWLL